MHGAKNLHAHHLTDRQCTSAVAAFQRDSELGLQGHNGREINAREIRPRAPRYFSIPQLIGGQLRSLTAKPLDRPSRVEYV